MTDNDDDGRGCLVPNWADFIARVGRQKHLCVGDLQAGDVLAVVTKNHRYQFKIIDAAHRRVEITSDHPDFPGPYVGYLQGSVIHPSSGTMFLGRVQLDFCIIWSSPELLSKYSLPIFVLTATQEVLINGVKIFPSDTGDAVD